jgi:hypothetical protein
MNDCVDFDSVDLQSIDEATNQLKAANQLIQISLNLRIS